MAIKRFTPQVYKFSWEGIEFGLRLPTVAEMIEITRARDAYWATCNDEKPGGDQTKLGEYQFTVGKIVTCDPENARNPWFAENLDKQKELAANGVEKDVAEDMPSSFFVAVTEFFNATIVRANLDDEQRKKFDEQVERMRKASEEDEKGEGDSEAGKSISEPSNGTPTIPTPTDSGASVSVSQSISSAPSISSTPGTTVSS